MTFQTEFPDYPAADMPVMPEGFEDTSWHNNSAPSFSNTKIGLHIWMDYVDADMREIPGGKRFLAYETDEDGAFTNDEPIVETDSWQDILDLIAKCTQ